MFIPEPAKHVLELTGVKVIFRYIEDLNLECPIIRKISPLVYRVDLRNTDPQQTNARYPLEFTVSNQDPDDPYDDHPVIGRPLIAPRDSLKNYIYTVYACRLAAGATGKPEVELRHKVLKTCGLLRTDVEHSTAHSSVNRLRGALPVAPRVVAIAKKLL